MHIEARKLYVANSEDLERYLVLSKYNDDRLLPKRLYPNHLQLDREWEKAFDLVRKASNDPQIRLQIAIGLSESQPGKILHKFGFRVPETQRQETDLINNTFPLYTPIPFGQDWLNEQVERQIDDSGITLLGKITSRPPKGVLDTVGRIFQPLCFEPQDLFRLVRQDFLIVGLVESGWNQLAFRSQTSQPILPEFTQPEFEKMWADYKDPEAEIIKQFDLVVYCGRQGKILQKVYI